MTQSSINRVQSILGEVGKTITYRRRTTSGYDAATGGVAPETVTDYNVKVGIKDFKPYQIQGLVQQGDRMVIISALDLPVRPNESDTVLMDGKSYNIMGVHEVFHRNEDMAFKLHIRGG